jgi:hypothetical protein
MNDHNTQQRLAAAERIARAEPDEPDAATEARAETLLDLCVEGSTSTAHVHRPIMDALAERLTDAQMRAAMRAMLSPYSATAGAVRDDLMDALYRCCYEAAEKEEKEEADR